MRTARLVAVFAVAVAARAASGQESAAPPVTAPAAEHGSTECGAGPTSTTADGHLWAEVDYVRYWLKPVCLTVPTITAGSNADAQPGAGGQPGTQLLQGLHKFQFDGASGLRPRLGAWLGDDRLFGVEVEGFVLEQVAASSDVNATATSAPTFIAFQNPDNSHAALPFSIPGVVTASSAAVGRSQLWGVEGNLAAHFCADRGGCTLHATGLFGCRYLQLDDRVTVTNQQVLVSDPSVRAVGEADFATRNQFVGAQVGSRLGVSHGPLSLDLATKLALGGVHLVSTVAGGPLLSGASVLPPLVPGPVLALHSNVGRSASDRIAVVPEFNLRLRWRVADHVYLTLGYNALYWNRILCPGDEMDPHANVTELPFRGPVVGPPAPTPQFKFTDAFAHGLELGFGMNF
jgi:hypothetical protein